MGTKNNPKNRVKTVEKIKFQDKEIEPIFYYGKHANHGNYMAARYCGSNLLVLDENNVPMPWKKIMALINN